MAISVVTRAFQALLFLSSLSLIASPGFSLSFSLNFTESSNYNDIVCKNDASVDNNTCQNLARWGLTKNNLQEGSGDSVGMAFYNRPVPLWDNTTGEVTNFVTTFSFSIKNNTETNYGDGLAFFLSAYPPPTIVGGGGNLGLFNESTMFNESANHIVVVEFDTFYNTNWDPSPDYDATDCHIGIDINKINSTSWQSIRNSLLIGKNMTAQIHYSNSTQTLTLYLWRDDNRTINFNISTKVDLKSTLPNETAIGFSATTGASEEVHLIYSWSFNSTLDVAPSNNNSDKHTFSNRVIGAMVAFALIFLVLLGTLLYIVQKKGLSKKRETEMENDELMDSEFEKGRGPKKFLYKKLAAATNDFAENYKLGEGGFGSVYQGILVDEGAEVAIKRVSKDSKQGKKEYISEVKIISQLRHRHLVQLIGWCHEHGELLLIYELMHNGSLDSHLYHKEKILTWPIRHKIVLGVGLALLYLHEECEQLVVHRDIKPSNIMLDSNFTAKLGDFGLARLIDHESGAQATMPAGTTGYIAPECVISGITSTESDIYSFGIVLLEIACGRRPVVFQEDVHKVRLVEWVWSLYGSGSILDAVDRQLNGEFEAQEAERFMVVGLWCAHPDYSLRPSIRQAINALKFEAPLPTLPPKMPLPIYASSMDSTKFLCSSSVGISSGEIGYTSTSHGTTASSSISATTLSTSSSSWPLR
jgi:serine/threonine protein kinase